MADKTLSDRFPITINEEARELFMSFGLLDELTRVVGDPARIGTVTLDPEFRQEFLTKLFAKRKKSGKIEEQTDFDDLDVAVEELEAALVWAQEHVLSFFVRSFRNIQKVTDHYGTEITNLTSSLAGSKSSPLKKP